VSYQLQSRIAGITPRFSCQSFFFKKKNHIINLILYTRDSDPSTPSQAPSNPLPHADPDAWHVVREFATTEMSLPEAEKCVENILGARYVDTNWRPAFNAVMDAEGDSDAVASTIEQLVRAACQRTGLKLRIPARQPPLAQLTAIENEVSASLQELRTRNCIFGEPPSLDEFLEPAEEQEVEGSFEFEGGDKAIVAAVQKEIAEKVGEVIEVSDDEEDLDSAEPVISRSETLALCQQLQGACLQFGNVDSLLPLELLKQIHLFHAQLRHNELLHGTQTTIDSFFR
jgi:hypothetical protein